MTPAMAERTNKLQGKQESVHAKGSRGIAARLAVDAPQSKEGSQKGLATPNSLGDIGKKFVANGGNNRTPSPSPAMADRNNNLPWNQVPLHAEVTRTSEEYRTDYTGGTKIGNKRGVASPKTCGDKIANKVTRNKKTDDRVKNGKQLNAEGRRALLARLEQQRAWGKPPPKRGDVTKAIVEEGVKKLIDTGKSFCCALGPFDVDAFVRDLPFPTKSEPTATLWAKVEV